MRALDIGSHRIANYEHLGAIDGIITRPPRHLERPLVDWRIWLASLDHLAAGRLITLGNCAGAIKELPPVLDHDIWIGADELEVARAHSGKDCIIIGWRLAPRIDKAGAKDELRLAKRHAARRLAAQSQSLL